MVYIVIFMKLFLNIDLIKLWIVYGDCVLFKLVSIDYFGVRGFCRFCLFGYCYWFRCDKKKLLF